MKVPARAFTFPAGFACEPAEIEPGVWQDHIVRHPLGVHRKLTGRGPAPWNLEGWDRGQPPVISAKRRGSLLEAISGLATGTGRCLVPEFTGGQPPVVEPERPACVRCAKDVRGACTALLHDRDEVGGLYGAVVDRMLQAVEEGAGELVLRTQFTTRLMTKAGARTADTGLVVMSWGFAAGRANQLVARVSCGDGTRVEFYLGTGNAKQLRWRTTYREDLAGAQHFLGSKQSLFLRDFPRSAPMFGGLSDRCVVARSWWRSHAS